MRDREILATYYYENDWHFDWLEDDAEVEEWLEENKDCCTKIEIIRIHGVELIYESESEE